jgi:hypothetical protein
MKNNKIFATIALNFPTCIRLFVPLKRDKLIQYIIMANSKIPKTIFDEKF